MFKLIFFVPKLNAESVKSSIFKTGAGKLGNYSHCSFEMSGTGQFKPLQGSNPTIGQVDKIEKVDELRIEILCSPDNIDQAIAALKSSHPYEEPAYEVYKLEKY